MNLNNENKAVNLVLENSTFFMEKGGINEYKENHFFNNDYFIYKYNWIFKTNKC